MVMVITSQNYEHTECKTDRWGKPLLSIARIFKPFNLILKIYVNMSYVDYLWNVAYETAAENLQLSAIRGLDVDYQFSTGFRLNMKCHLWKTCKLSNHSGKRPRLDKNCTARDNQYGLPA
jgi:hypothetical protein